jgi:methyl-accepting chemotaxis protein
MKLTKFKRNSIISVFIVIILLFSGIYFTYSYKTDKQINTVLNDILVDEIRKLSEQTAKSTDMIGEIVNAMKDISFKVATSIGNVNTAIDEQVVSSENVEKSFEESSSIYNQLERSFEEIHNQLSELNIKNGEIQAAITNMVAVSEETAASGDDIQKSVEHQVSLIVGTATSIESIKAEVNRLGEKLGQF